MKRRNSITLLAAAFLLAGITLAVAQEPDDPPQMPGVVEGTGVVSYWNFDETTGTVFADLVGPNEGALGAGATMGQPGKVGNAIEFAGVSGAGVNAFTATTSGMPFGDSPATVSYWAKKNSNSGYDVHCCYGTPEQGHFRGVWDSPGGSNVIFLFYHWYNDTTAYDVPLGTTDWHLIVTVFDPANSERRIYIDGVLKATQADVNGVYVVDGEPFRIGGGLGGDELDGLIDDLAVWNIALDETQVESLWNDGSGRPVSDLGGSDSDGDGVLDADDNCPDVPNPDQDDLDGDGIGDLCDPNPTGLCAPVPDGLVSWWDGDAVSGTTVSDIADGNDGTLSNGATTSAGLVEQALTFDGVDDYVAVSSVNFGGGDYTIEGWFLSERSTPTNQESLIVGHPPNDLAKGCFHVEVQWDNGQLRWLHRVPCGTSGGTNVYSNTDLRDGMFHHFAAVKSSATMILYVDGDPVGSAMDSTDLPASQYVDMGRLRGNVRYLDGQIDEMKIYNRAVTAEQVQAIYDAGSSGTCQSGLDTDQDGVVNIDDNCPENPNPEQTDTDEDGLGNACDDDDDNDTVLDGDDNCPFSANPEQFDLDGDGLGDVCDADIDGDGHLNEDDNCPSVPNPYQDDTDLDGQGDACDADDDNDGICDTDQPADGCTAGPDNCSTVVNPGQEDLDGDGIGDVCDADVDGDGIDNDVDNCEWTANASQDDTDFDGEGDACDPDDDNDSWLDGEDNCPLVYNLDQDDLDGDGVGDACDADLDGDGADNAIDNCPTLANSGQADLDGDGLGDACDPDIDGDGVLNGSDLCAATPADALVDPGNGCSIAQLCPCEGPRGTNQPWKNHGKYVSCTAHATEGFLDLGLITEEEKDALVSAAAQSDCGNRH